MCVFFFSHFYKLVFFTDSESQKGKDIFFFKIFIWLQQVLVAACNIFSCGACEIQFPNQGWKQDPALGAWSLSHWTVRDVPIRTHCMQCYTTSTQYSSSIQKEFSGSDSKESTCNRGDSGLIPELGRSPGEGNGNPLQYSCLENPMDRGAWWPTYSPCGHKELEITE